jgi:hypothetical protein
MAIGQQAPDSRRRAQDQPEVPGHITHAPSVHCSSTLAVPDTSGIRDSGQARHPHGIVRDRVSRRDHSPDRRCLSKWRRIVRSSNQVTAATVRARMPRSRAGCRFGLGSASRSSPPGHQGRCRRCSRDSPRRAEWDMAARGRRGFTLRQPGRRPARYCPRDDTVRRAATARSDCPQGR